MFYLYYIENKITGTLYIGKTNNLERRFLKHANDSENIPLNRAIKKYGMDNFQASEFQYFDNEAECYEMEKFWIESCKENGISLYNIAEGGKGIFSGTNHYMYGKHHTEESRKKMSLSHTGMILSEETKMKISNANKGKVNSAEARQKISNSKKGKPLTEEHKLQISKTSKGRKVSEKNKKENSIRFSGEKNPSAKISDQEVFNILSIWFSISELNRSKNGFKKMFYEKYVKNIYKISMITIYEYLSGKKRKDIFELFIQ